MKIRKLVLLVGAVGERSSRRLLGHDHALGRVIRGCRSSA